ncbi:helicase HerA domain-containing protein [Frankia sp. Cj5]|uniref:helicase HerA domain-containing protein n=1 Tax=Frankia sp. Cj5 TaxID=2880978 RepID=UPI001EF67352|nr:DUF87 domain-containing protein [Frankia sp. Cj5]
MSPRDADADADAGADATRRPDGDERGVEPADGTEQAEERGTEPGDGLGTEPADERNGEQEDEPELMEEPENADPAGEKTDNGENGPREAATDAAREDLAASLITLGFVAFDGQGTDNTSSGVLVSEQLRRHFRRDSYVGVDDAEQGIIFLGRVVEGPFHSPHEIGSDSAISRTTLLHPDRTMFRPTYYASGTIEILGEVGPDESVRPTSTRPRPYSRTFIYPADRLRRMLGLEGDMQLGSLLGYEDVHVEADSQKKAFLPRNVGIFGTVGSGKSNTTQVLMEEALRAEWAVVVIDVEGEYVRMDQGNDDDALAALLCEQFPDRLPRGIPDLRVYVPNAGETEASDAMTFKVPIADVPDEIIADIMEFSEAQVRMWGAVTSQAKRLAETAPRRSRLGVLDSPPGRSPNAAAALTHRRTSRLRRRTASSSSVYRRRRSPPLATN